jgi:hypothetical protein
MEGVHGCKFGAKITRSAVEHRVRAANEAQAAVTDAIVT